jgi:hypothetical protein
VYGIKCVYCFPKLRRSSHTAACYTATAFWGSTSRLRGPPLNAKIRRREYIIDLIARLALPIWTMCELDAQVFVESIKSLCFQF